MLAIKNALIYTMKDEVIEDGFILMENGKITAVGKDIDIPLEAEVIDAEGRMVTPGFVDAHCHLGLFEDSIGFEGSDGNERPYNATVKGYRRYQSYGYNLQGGL